MKLTRNLKQKMSGPDVRFVKDALFSLGFYNSKIKQITSKITPINICAADGNNFKIKKCLLFRHLITPFL